MWNRAELKANARFALKNFYWLAFAVTIIINVLSVAVTRSTPQPDYEILAGDFEGVMEIISNNLIQFITMYAAIIVITAAVGIFITSPIYVGVRRFYMEATDGRAHISNILYGFKNRYFNVVKVSFIKTVIVAFCSILVFLIGYGIGIILLFAGMTEFSAVFISAGIIAACVTLIRKEIQFFFVDFLLAENPGIGWRDALQRSKEMTSGDKFAIFVLRLSFFGWILLGAIVCIIGALFVEPYIYETEEMLYRVKTGRTYINFKDGPEI